MHQYTDAERPSFSFRRIAGQTLLATSFLLILAVYNSANPPASSPANNNTASSVIRDFE